MCGFIAQLVEQRTGNAEGTGSNPVEALIFFQASFFQYYWLNWKIYCDDHSALSKDTLFKTKIDKTDTLIKTKIHKIDILFKTKIPKNIPWLAACPH